MEERKVPRLGLVLVILAIGLIALLMRPQGRILGLKTEDFASVVYYLPILAMMSVAILTNRRHLGKSLKQLLIWFVIILALASASLFRDDARQIGARLLAGLVPGHAVTILGKNGEEEVLLSRDMTGHFSATVRVNNQPIPMMIDTGATTVTLTYDDAVAAGIIPENLIYSARVSTANGETVAAPIDLTLVQLGPITRENVRALVTRRGALDQSLLGMSFLSTLSSLHIKSDELKLRN